MSYAIFDKKDEMYKRKREYFLVNIRLIQTVTIQTCIQHCKMTQSSIFKKNVSDKLDELGDVNDKRLY